MFYLRALELESYLKLRALEASSFVLCKQASHLRLMPWSTQQLSATLEVVVAVGGGATSRAKGAQPPRKFEDFALGKRSKNASVMHHFNQKNTTNSMERCARMSNMIKHQWFESDVHVSKHYPLSKHCHARNHDLPLRECLRLRNGSDLRLRVHPTRIVYECDN